MGVLDLEGTRTGDWAYGGAGTGRWGTVGMGVRGCLSWGRGP